jgi:hypothetical protein
VLAQRGRRLLLALRSAGLRLLDQAHSLVHLVLDDQVANLTLVGGRQRVNKVLFKMVWIALMKLGYQLTRRFRDNFSWVSQSQQHFVHQQLHLSCWWFLLDHRGLQRNESWNYEHRVLPGSIFAGADSVMRQNSQDRLQLLGKFDKRANHLVSHFPNGTLHTLVTKWDLTFEFPKFWIRAGISFWISYCKSPLRNVSGIRS